MAKDKKEFKRQDIIDEIVKMRLEDGMSTKAIIDMIKLRYGYQNSYAYTLHQDARKKIVELYDQSNLNTLPDAIGKLEDMYMMHIHKKNFKAALDVLKEINKISGHYTEKINLSIIDYKANFDE